MKQKMLFVLALILLLSVTIGGCVWRVPNIADNRSTETPYDKNEVTSAPKDDPTPSIKTPSTPTANPVNTKPILLTEDCLYFRPNGGDGGASFYFNDNAEVSADTINAFVYRKGYKLKGWNTKADGSGKAVKSEEVATLFKNKTLEKETSLYAMWEKNAAGETSGVREVVYSSNLGGSGGATQYITDLGKKSYKVLAPMCYSETRVFLYWNTSPYRDGDTYYPGDEISSKFSTLNLYAVWADKDTMQINEFVSGNLCWDSWLDYSGNGSEKGGKTAHISGGGFEYYTIEDADVAGEYEGYVFKCWNSKADGTGRDFYPGDRLFTLSEIEPDMLELYAIWEKV